MFCVVFLPRMSGWVGHTEAGVGTDRQTSVRGRLGSTHPQHFSFLAAHTSDPSNMSVPWSPSPCQNQTCRQRPASWLRSKLPSSKGGGAHFDLQLKGSPGEGETKTC